jgi:hypothetical protein
MNLPINNLVMIEKIIKNSKFHKRRGRKKCNQGNLTGYDHLCKDGQGEHANRQPSKWIGDT